jgi:type IV pilus assembly protein PilM
MFFRQKKIIGLDIGTSSVKLAELESSRGGYTLSKFAVQPIGPGAVNGGEIVDVGQVSQAIQAAAHASATKRKLVCSGMWGSSVVVKKIAMPRMEAKLVSEQVKWEAEQYIPFDVNEISLEHSILKGSSSPEVMDVLLVAAKQEFVFRYIEAIEGAGLKCAIMDVSGFALANCFEANYGATPGTIALLNIGAGTTNLVVLTGGEAVFCRDISAGGFSYTNEIHRSMGVSLEEAEALKLSASYGQGAPDEVNSIISATNEAVVEEIRSSFDFYGATSGGGAISRFYASGGGVFTPGLVEGVAKATGIAHESFDPFRRVPFSQRAISGEYASQIRSIAGVAIGLGMRKPGAG